jgi:hypothetical protein
VSDATDKVTVELWEKCVRHAEGLLECSRDSIIKPIIINQRTVTPTLTVTVKVKKYMSETETYVFNILHG